MLRGSRSAPANAVTECKGGRSQRSRLSLEREGAIYHSALARCRAIVRYGTCALSRQRRALPSLASFFADAAHAPRPKVSTRSRLNVSVVDTIRVDGTMNFTVKSVEMLATFDLGARLTGATAPRQTTQDSCGQADCWEVRRPGVLVPSQQQRRMRDTSPKGGWMQRNDVFLKRPFR